MSGTTQAPQLLPVAELERQLKEHRRLATEAAEDLRRRRFEAIKNLPIRWTVQPKVYHSFRRELVGVRIDKLPVETPEFLAEFGPLTLDESAAKGMFYYRTDEGILTHEGGGTHVLVTEPRLCSDAEWQSIIAGIIPEKFIYVPRGN